MFATTHAQAIAAMRHLMPTRSRRLLGQPASATQHCPIERILRDTPEPWRSRITADLADRHAGILTPASAEYLVLSDNLVIAVLTAAARVEVPDYPLSSVQRRHRAEVVRALTDLPRHSILQLADRRSAIDGRHEETRFDTAPPAATAIRIASVDDPTVTTWVTLGPSLADAVRDVRETGYDPDRILIISAPSYGRYGIRRHRLDLAALCMMCRLAVAHTLPVSTIGDWLDHEGATTTEIDIYQLPAVFSRSYLGLYTGERAYAEHRIAALGWTTALADAGIPAGFLDVFAVTRRWFTDDVYAIRVPPGDRIAVFSRAPGHPHDRGQAPR